MLNTPLKIAIQMDPIADINIDSDTTFILALEAQTRGHKLYYYQPKDLSLDNSEVTVTANPIFLQRNKKSHFQIDPPITTPASSMDIILMRQDPPFDMNYLTYTYMLERIHPETLVINNPSQVRNCPEKLFACDFKEFMPATLITSDITLIKNFQKQHKQIVLKPLYSHGGQDVHIVENNLTKLFTKLLKKYNTPIIAQKFLPKITEGDKRIILINGKVAGALNRIPNTGSILSNLAQGGTAQKTTLTKKEQQLCDKLGPILVDKGLILVGIDVIDGHLTEINITSPTGIQSINTLDNTNLEKIFWNEVETILKLSS